MKKLSILVIVLFFVFLFGCTSPPAITLNATSLVNETDHLVNTQESNLTVVNRTVVQSNKTTDNMSNASETNATQTEKPFVALGGYENCGSIRSVTFVPMNQKSTEVNQCFSRNLKNCSHAQVFDESGAQTAVYTIMGKTQNICLIHIKTKSSSGAESAQTCKMDSTISFYLPNEFDGRRSIWLLKNASVTNEYNSSKTTKVYSLPCSDYSKSYLPVLYSNIENGLPFTDYGRDFYYDKSGSLGWIHTNAVRNKNLKDIVPGYSESDKKGKDALSLVSVVTGAVHSNGTISEEYKKISFQYVFNNDKSKCVWFSMTPLAASEVGASGTITNCNRDGSPINDSEIIKDWNYDSDDMIPYTDGLSSYDITEVYLQMRDLKNYRGPLFFDSIALQKINEFDDNIPVMVVEFEPSSNSKGPGYLLFNAKTGDLIKTGGYNTDNFPIKGLIGDYQG